MRPRSAALILGSIVLLMPLLPSAPASAVDARARDCTITGRLDVSTGILRDPPSPHYHGSFSGTLQFVCTGSHSNPPGTVGEPEMVGTALGSTAGSFGIGNCGGIDLPGVGAFCGSYSVGPFTIGPGCAGTIGGKLAGNLSQSNYLANDWSTVNGNKYDGGMTCSTMAVIDPVSEVGTISFTAQPVPTEVDGQVNGVDSFPGECADPGPPPGDPNVQATWACQVDIEGTVTLRAQGQ